MLQNKGPLATVMMTNALCVVLVGMLSYAWYFELSGEMKSVRMQNTTLLENNAKQDETIQSLQSELNSQSEALNTIEQHEIEQDLRIVGFHNELEDSALAFSELQRSVNAFEDAVVDIAPKLELPTTWTGPRLTRTKGVNQGPSGRETYYNLDMTFCIQRMRRKGYSAKEYPYWVREDGCKMLGKYIMVAANFKIRPLGTVLETSLGWAIVVDTGGFARHYPKGLDIAVDW